ncbi:hypothetical protein U0035_09075 [Niabella yanshanensis]|uniref:Toxin-antitoxin system YwqK family antitoxin n=1 Tax=Niabella yanshanensis TaxID=577386 RepID=A0ABZ0WC14_9BACT|nr:hypothetical protein [Niabella yanshanensis]WQD40294.1 hypothetical protein U0035_09075 [Niabella yanshanensis]
MKTLLFPVWCIVCLSSNVSLKGQDLLPDNFTIGDFAEIYAGDSIKLFFNCFGGIVNKRCADYYRIGKMDTEFVNVKGPFRDYYLNGKLYLEASITNGNLEGSAVYYYRNGRVREKGQYKNHRRDGQWSFYYPNGQLQKVYQYENDFPLVQEAFTLTGKQTVANGNGYLKTEFSEMNECSKFEVSGTILNGKKYGTWTLSNINALQPLSKEVYDSTGNYIRSEDDNGTYLSKSRSGLSVFYGNENLLLTASSNICPGDRGSSSKIPFTLESSSFITDLQKQLDTLSSSFKNQWLITGITIGKKNDLINLNIASSINDTALERYIYDRIRDTKKWETSYLNDKKVVSSFLFTILVDDNKILIPTHFHFLSFKQDFFLK